MDFRLLGPLEVESGGSAVRIAGAKERAVLALLLLRANRSVSRERLIDELWGEHPPATARRTLEVHVSRLRRWLPSDADGERIASEAGGYRIRVQESELDVLRFERLVEEGRAALARGAPASAEARLTAALDLWRGDVLTERAAEPFAPGEVARLEELRVAAVEARAWAALALGHHAELIADLRAMVAEHPFREGLLGQLMLALYRSGRQAEALNAYLAGRRRLVDELGIEPGRELQELQQGILRQDVALDRPAVAADEPSPAVTEPGPGPIPSSSRRKVVTVLVGELDRSTAIADGSDPEAVEALLGRYVEAVRTIVEWHGGSIGRSFGTTVLAAFGVPQLHEDDALRACRAAVEIRSAMPELSAGGSVGITTGEVIAGPEGGLVSGTAVQLAAELARAAPEGEILLGTETVRLLGSLVEAEPFASLTLRGNELMAWRFCHLVAPTVRDPTPLIDRERELALLGDAFRRAVDERELQLFTVLGPAGIGKSRLVREFLTSIPSEAQVAVGRCLSYGQAITYWPLADVLRSVGEPARLALERVLSGGAASPQELAWTVRGGIERAAARRPLVVVVEDLHWAEPALLDLLDSICESSTGHPILLLCVARPELLETRPGWAGGKLNTTTVLLEPLATNDCERLVDALGRPLDPDQRRRVVRVAAGNALFLEELTAFVAGGGAGDLPPRIHALLQARLDGLPEPERVLLCGAAVEGTVFHTGSLRTLLPQMGAELGTLLAALTRKLLIRPVQAEPGTEDAFRFRHELIRETAYAATPKADRARLHEQFAGWLERHIPEREELSDLAAYHLEQAALARRDLGERDEALDGRAVAELAMAGRRARLRSDLRAAASLWRRSLVLLDEGDPRTPEVELDLALVLAPLGAFHEAARLLEHAAQQTADPAVAAAIRLARLQAQSFLAPEGVPAAIRRECADAIPLFEERDDHRRLALAWSVLGWAEWIELQVEAAAAAWTKAADHAHRAGDRGLEAETLAHRLLCLSGSRIPYAFAAAELERLARRFPGVPAIQACLAGCRAGAAFEGGRPDEARTLARQMLDDARHSGYTLVAAIMGAIFGQLALAAGDVDEAESRALDAVQELQALGERGLLSTAQATLAEVRIAQGRPREALELADAAEDSTSAQDRQTLVDANSARARAHAGLGELPQAKVAAAAATAIAQTTDSLLAQAHAQHALAEVLAAAGELSAALVAAESADASYTALERALERRRVATLEAEIRRRIAGSRTLMLAGEAAGPRPRGSAT